MLESLLPLSIYPDWLGLQSTMKSSGSNSSGSTPSVTISADKKTKSKSKKNANTADTREQNTPDDNDEIKVDKDKLAPWDLIGESLLRKGRPYLWIGDGRTVGKMHFDPYDNILVQLSGSKKFLLIDPSQNERLYEGHMREAEIECDVDYLNPLNASSATTATTATTRTSVIDALAAGPPRASDTVTDVRVHSFRKYKLSESTSMVHSPVEMHEPDLKRYPLARGLISGDGDQNISTANSSRSDSNSKGLALTHMECEVMAGEALWVPSYWWHEGMWTMEQFSFISTYMNLYCLVLI
jgi:hypothetical protein